MFFPSGDQAGNSFAPGPNVSRVTPPRSRSASHRSDRVVDSMRGSTARLPSGERTALSYAPAGSGTVAPRVPDRSNQATSVFSIAPARNAMAPVDDAVNNGAPVNTEGPVVSPSDTGLPTVRRETASNPCAVRRPFFEYTMRP